MNEEEFDALGRFRSFSAKDVTGAETQALRATALVVVLWGRTAEYLERQLELPQPKIPPGVRLEDLFYLARLLDAGEKRRRSEKAPGSLPLFTRESLEPRREILRQAIASLEGGGHD